MLLRKNVATGLPPVKNSGLENDITFNIYEIMVLCLEFVHFRFESRVCRGL